MRKHLPFLLLAAVLQLPAGAAVTLKFATLAPDGSTWMQSFDAVRKEVAEVSGGNVKLKAYPSGVLGEEKDVLFKMKVGQVDGAGFLGAGTSQVCPDADALMMPMLFRTYEEVDAVMAAVGPRLEEQALKNGFVLLGWTEIGFNYLYSTVPVRSVDDLRHAKPWTLQGDATMAELFKAGKVSGIPVSVGDVLVALQTGLLQTVFAPPLAAVSMQWHTRVKYRNDTRLMYSVGGVFVSSRSWEKIPADLRPKVKETFAKHLAALRTQVRKSNDEALQVLEKQGVQVAASTPEQVAEFETLRDATVAGLKGRDFSAETWAEVMRHLEAFRASAPKP